MSRIETTPRFAFEELKQIQGQHTKLVNEQRRFTQQVGDNARLRLQKRLRQRVEQAEKRRHSSVFTMSKDSCNLENCDTFEQFMAATGGCNSGPSSAQSTPGGARRRSQMRRQPLSKLTNDSPATFTYRGREKTKNSPVVHSANTKKSDKAPNVHKNNDSPVVRPQTPLRRLNSAIVKEIISAKKNASSVKDKIPACAVAITCTTTKSETTTKKNRASLASENTNQSKRSVRKTKKRFSLFRSRRNRNGSDANSRNMQRAFRNDGVRRKKCRYKFDVSFVSLLISYMYSLQRHSKRRKQTL
jgi:hypothetical protein